jgi:hypothetical protein
MYNYPKFLEPMGSTVVAAVQLFLFIYCVRFSKKSIGCAINSSCMMSFVKCCVNYSRALVVLFITCLIYPWQWAYASTDSSVVTCAFPPDSTLAIKILYPVHCPECTCYSLNFDVGPMTMDIYMISQYTCLDHTCWTSLLRTYRTRVSFEDFVM